MTDFLNCQLPLREGLRGDFTRVLEDKRTSGPNRVRARGVLAAIEDLNTAVRILREKEHAGAAAAQCADELRLHLKQRQQELSYLLPKHEGLLRERDELAQRNGALTGQVYKLKTALAAANHENHFIDARAYGMAFIIGALASAALCVAGFSVL